MRPRQVFTWAAGCAVAVGLIVGLGGHRSPATPTQVSPTAITPYAPAAIPVSTGPVPPPSIGPVDTTDAPIPTDDNGSGGGSVYVPHVPHPHVYVCAGHHIHICL